MNVTFSVGGRSLVNSLFILYPLKPLVFLVGFSQNTTQCNKGKNTLQWTTSVKKKEHAKFTFGSSCNPTEGDPPLKNLIICYMYVNKTVHHTSECSLMLEKVRSLVEK